ncbi:DUF3304 domain-containing protein [Xanthomonas maliensis]|uniref:DUF3304 domain-containing protein n=1 Tax=Xanthomonas maliensis TaxID=1321368 RepID=UPI001264D60E|nr:DUF3304 domain-containing protein [Xanthomonas maliensis]KAB7769378.1 hypothetical protein CKY51_07275 [Xanthomonas maliensis]
MNLSRVVAVAAVAGLAGCSNGLSHARTVCVTGYNEYDRKIHEFWLDNESKAGCFGNPSGRAPGQNWGGGGKFSCGCSVTPGRTVNLEWTFVLPKQDFYAGKPPEQHSVRVKIPQPQSATSRYFRIYFRNNGTVSLQWVNDMGADELAPTDQRVGQRGNAP